MDVAEERIKMKKKKLNNKWCLCNHWIYWWNSNERKSFWHSLKAWHKKDEL